MTLAGPDLARRLAALPPHDRDAVLARLSPQAIDALRAVAPVPEARLRAARADTADPVTWLREQLPALAPLPPGPHHAATLGLLDVDGPTGTRSVLSAFRGAGKSTLGTQALPLLAAIRRSHRFGVIVRAREPDAIAAVAGVRGLIDTHPHLVDRYPWIAPANRSDEELRLRGGFVLLARGSGSAIRGLTRTVQGATVRPDLAIVDDLETEDTARSELQTARLEEWLLSVVGQLGGPPGTTDTSPLDVLLIGTTLEPRAVVTRALAGEDAFAGWRRLRYPIVGVVDDQGERVVDPHDPAEAIEGVPVPDGASPGDEVPVWPDGAPLSFAARLRHRDPSNPSYVGSRVYSREYALRPVVSGSTMFAADDLLTVERLADRILSGEVTPKAVAIGVDPAASERDSADYTAWVTVALVKLAAVLGRDALPRGVDPWALAVLTADRDRLSLPGLVKAVTTTASRWSRWSPTVAYEAQGAFVWGARELQRARVAKVRPVHVSADKVTRATPLQGWTEPGRVLVDAALHGTPWWHELTGFTGGPGDAHDDFVDATVHAGALLTSAWRLDPLPASKDRPHPLTGAR